MTAPAPWESDLLAAWRAIPSPFEPGLTPAEFDAVEARYGFRFPPDLRFVLADRLPVARGFPNWRTGERWQQDVQGPPRAVPLTEVLDWPVEGLLLDVERAGFWLPAFGPRAPDPASRATAVRARAARAPRLIPVFSHRYLPAEPHAPGNPVLSVHGSDTIHYGSDLAEYLHIEFLGRPHASMAGPRRVDLWSEIEAFDG